ncbi:MAG: hypothetical protein KY433_07465 [Actinobacteria bacterium]|nr:hypothetical protein [Actinomycetota bacterium]
MGRIAHGHLVATLNRGDEWQVAYVIAKGSYKEIRDAGLPTFRRAVAEVIPEFADRVDALSFDFPAWGGAGSAGHLGLSDAVFLSMFAAWSERYGFRRSLTLGGMTLGLLASPALSVAFDQAIPALPLIAAGYLLPNLDRIARLLGHEEPGVTASG